MRLARMLTVTAICAGVLTSPAVVQAQQAAQPAPPAPRERDPDQNLDALQPDFTISALPTTLRLPRFKGAFRVTHRFGRPLGSGSFGDLAADFFSFDSSAQIGLEYRFGLMRGLQGGIYRTNDRTIEFFLERNLVQQSASRPLGLSAFAAMDGTNNFRDSYSPALGAIVSRKVGRLAALYVEPIWVNNSNSLPSELVDSNDSFLLGIGGRVRVRRTVYVIAEGAPRVAGFDPGRAHMTGGIEKLVGGHVFQLNVSNGVGTTIGQVARGGSRTDWHLGFNITRKFWR
ncbi:MAG TPA: DUF5777 family beta-barrel protein [Vicinamibacterales bacterium]|jgi:uncharacterized beta barrel domain-containing protein DUF5777|nr:DUF5777 family beta-barrel protein [Vicinamibacterales bacterium]